MEQFIIQSNNNGIALAEQYISRICDERNIISYYTSISVAVLAAVENAIVHGNKNDASKQVVIATGDCKGGLFFSVSDQGDGFDYTQYEGVPDREGRGASLFMMRNLADRMTYSDQGRTVRLEFHILGLERSLVLERISLLDRFFAKKEIEA